MSQVRVVADLHLHSPYARAVSKHMTIPEMSHQAHRRGIQLLATGDWTHPQWVHHLQTELAEWQPGIYASRSQPEGAKFLLSTELSCIFSQGGRGRRVHLLVMVPSLEAVLSINQALARRGANLTADGRPILGMSCIQLTDLVLQVEPKALIIPAHAWTPWFGVLGSNGGFDSLEEAFGQFSPQIYAIETGLSSDPLMNWKVPELDSRAIVSFSDAHSPPKMGREATVFEFDQNTTDHTFAYEDIYQAIAERSLKMNAGKLKLAYTIEFYPEEGKYHWDGHRACQVVQPPSKTREIGATCPVCGKSLTIGVENRVEQLGAEDRLSLSAEKRVSDSELVVSTNPQDQTRQPFVNLVPLQEIIAEVEGKGFGTKGVMTKYNQLLDHYDEFNLLQRVPSSELRRLAGEKVTQAIVAMRQGNLRIEPGYDGVYGTVHLDLSEVTSADQPSLF